ncbi:MAG TPA: PhnD/SsuA/transferrin family substrate-binding protein [Anaerolineaceae bacterium]|nr:PhnD/SsuA/transferrin family substrate-binding protein [Anaerolineaceae bacterium]
MYRTTKPILLALLLAGWMVSLLAGCTASPLAALQASPTPTQPQATATVEATPTTDPAVKDPEAPLDPMGSERNPVVIGFVSTSQDPTAEQAASGMAQSLTTQTGINIQSRLFADYDTLLKSMEDQTVHVAWLPPFTYLIAQKAGTADVGLVASHFGVFSYGFQIVAHHDSGFNVYYDPQTNQSTSDANIALIQFHEKRPCWVEPLSPSGYVIPLGFFNANGIVLKDGVIAQSHGSVIRAVYAQGICDFGVTYATYGDPRTASSILESLPDVMEKVIILWQSDPVIPNLNVSFLPSMPADTREKITQALIDYAKTEDGRTSLSTMHAYDIETLKRTDDSFYNDFRTAFENSAAPLYSLLGK